MGIRIHHIILTVVLLAMALSCSKPRTIPSGKLARMYAEMFMVDQWVSDNKSLQNSADTMFVYGNIFDRYGYTPEDYRYTVSQYLKDPESFSKIAEAAKNILNDSLKTLDRLDSLELAKEGIMRGGRALVDSTGGFRLYRDILVGFFPSDTVVQGRDSLRFSISIPVLDTMYQGPAMIAKEDSLRLKEVRP